MGEFRSPPSVKNARLRIRSLLKQADLSHVWTENRAVVRTFEQCDIVVLLRLVFPHKTVENEDKKAIFWA
jgi:hypothetical protein